MHSPPLFSFDGFSGLVSIPALAGGLLILNLIVILLLAVAVKDDAEARAGKRGGGLFLVGPWLWFFIVLFTGGYLATLAYWLIHYSSLRGRDQEVGEQPVDDKFRPPAGVRE